MYSRQDVGSAEDVCSAGDIDVGVRSASGDMYVGACCVRRRSSYARFLPNIFVGCFFFFSFFCGNGMTWVNSPSCDLTLYKF